MLKIDIIKCMDKDRTLKEHIYWLYANLAAYRVALENNPPKYTREYWMVRTKLFKGLTEGNMSMSSIYKNERHKLSNASRCTYCDKESSKLTLDHLIPRYSEGKDNADNLVYACQSCNSSKGKLDYFDWCARDDIQINPEVAERYLKLLYMYADDHKLLDKRLADKNLDNMPFDINTIPEHFSI